MASQLVSIPERGDFVFAADEDRWGGLPPDPAVFDPAATDPGTIDPLGKKGPALAGQLAAMPRLAGVAPASRLEVRPAPEMVSSGVAAIDALTGGLPRGCLTEICGAASSGRTSLLLAALAAATRRQEACALVDACDALHPHSAEVAGVDRERLLWVRCGEDAARNNSPQRHRGTEKSKTRNLFMEAQVEQALRVTDLLLQSGGFGMVAIDLGDIPAKTARRVPLTSWFRFQRAVERTPTVLLVITRIACAQTCVALGMQLRGTGVKRQSSVAGRWSLAAGKCSASEDKPDCSTRLSAIRFQLSASSSQVSGKNIQEEDAFGSPSHAQMFEGLEVQSELLRSRLERKPAASVRTEFVTRAVRAG